MRPAEVMIVETIFSLIYSQEFSDGQTYVMKGSILDHASRIDTKYRFIPVVSRHVFHLVSMNLEFDFNCKTKVLIL